MSTNKDLFKEAIADAKAVREAALTNAKAALEEALTPKLQSMIAAKLQEMGNDEEVKEVDFMRHSDTSDEMQDMGFGNTEQGRPGHADKMNEEELEEDFDLSSILAELDAEDSVSEEKDEAMYEAKKKKAKDEDEKDEMKEAIDTINTLRSELQEINLLNAKLLFVNKIFSAKNLTESQKVKVIASFDKATTPKQAKELYESIQSSTIGASKKSQIKESLGFASKAAGVAPKNSANSIVESNDVIARMQKLANIIK